MRAYAHMLSHTCARTHSRTRTLARTRSLSSPPHTPAGRRCQAHVPGRRYKSPALGHRQPLLPWKGLLSRPPYCQPPPSAPQKARPAHLASLGHRPAPIPEKKKKPAAWRGPLTRLSVAQTRQLVQTSLSLPLSLFTLPPPAVPMWHGCPFIVCVRLRVCERERGRGRDSERERVSVRVRGRACVCLYLSLRQRFRRPLSWCLPVPWSLSAASSVCYPRFLSSSTTASVSARVPFAPASIPPLPAQPVLHQSTNHRKRAGLASSGHPWFAPWPNLLYTRQVRPHPPRA